MPAGPCGIPSSARVETSFKGSALTCGNGAESSPVPTEPNVARFAGVSGTRISVPSMDPAFSGRSRPMFTARQSRSWCSAHDARSTMSRSSSSGSGPSALRQSPHARSDAAAHGLAHGTPARSPASAMITSRMPASGSSVISTSTRIMNALASSRSRSPFTNSGRSTARSATWPITPGPAFSSSHSSNGPSVACPHGLPCACTRPSLLTCAGATATTFKNTTASPARIFPVPPITSADRSPSNSGLPFRSGDTRSPSRTATISDPPPGTSPSPAMLLTEREPAGYEDTRGSCDEE